jgi:GTP-binding protein HflX
VASSDLILHVRDIAHPDSDAQAEDVEAVLASLGLDEDGAPPRMEVWNKIDLLEGDALAQRLAEAERKEHVVAVSALSGEGVDRLRDAIAEELHSGAQTHHIRLDASDGTRAAWLHARGDVLDQQADGDVLQLAVKLSPENWARFQRL